MLQGHVAEGSKAKLGEFLRGTAAKFVKAGFDLRCAFRDACQRLGAAWGTFTATPFVRFMLRHSFWISLAVVICALLSTVVTFLVLNGLLTPLIVPTRDVVRLVLVINGLFVFAIACIIGLQIAKLMIARKRQAAGSGLHFRIAGIFSLVALFPAVMLAIFATVTIDRTFDTFFSTRVKSIVDNSIEVAQSYVQESVQVIRADMIGVAGELEQNAALFAEDRPAFEKFFSALVSLRAIPSAYLIDENRKVIASGAQPGQLYQPPPAEDMARAKDGRVVPIGWDLANGVAALKKLSGYENTYLYAIRPINPDVIQVFRRTRDNIVRFAQLEQTRKETQMVFALMYLMLALTLLTSAIWSGLVFANRLVAPIRKLIGAAQEVSQGNLDVQLEGGSPRDDMGQLRATFKQMTVDLKTQRDDIMSANVELDERRRFIEAVLSGVTAGVIGLDAKGRITLVNRSARELLGFPEDKLTGRPLSELVPEFGPVIEKARRQGRRPVQAQVTLLRESGERNFALQVTREQADRADFGLVVTFDDVTQLTVAQRSVAWADVARRIAHEIKNPLTPIQLSAERIRRKYGDAIKADREVFDRCTDTIIRHVGDIGRMVDEFSSFARMPQAVFEEQDIRDIVNEAVILFQMSRPEIEFVVEVPLEPVEALCDRRLLTQAVTNLVKNAGEAIDAWQSSHGGNGQAPAKGRVLVRLSTADQRLMIDVIDNGCGLPRENRHRLVEPYVTTRQKGTGLGLAIVQRITEQHGGTLELADAAAAGENGHGAWIRMSFPITHGSDAHRPASDPAPNGKAHEDSPPVVGGQEGANHGV